MVCCIISVTTLTSWDKRLFSFSIFALRYFGVRATVVCSKRLEPAGPRANCGCIATSREEANGPIGRHGPW